MWVVAIGLLIFWFILRFALHKGGYVHIVLVGAISLLVLRFIAHRKTQYHKTSAGQ